MLHRVLSIPDFASLEYNGKQTGGIYGFLCTLNTVVGAVPSGHKIIAVFDGKHSERRKKYFEGYKANRKAYNEEEKIFKDEYFKLFNFQKKIITNEILPSLGVLPITLSDREADDVIYRICEMFQSTEEVIVISEDKDMLQLLTHFPNVTVFRPIAKQRVQRSNFKELFNMPWELFLIYKSLVGDKSDGIPGIAGVGPVTVTGVLEKIDINDAIPSLLKYVQTLHETEVQNQRKTSSKEAKIFTNWGTFARNLELIDLSREDFTNAELISLKQAIEGFTPKVYVDFFRNKCYEFGFQSILKDFNYWLAPFEMVAGVKTS